MIRSLRESHQNEKNTLNEINKDTVKRFSELHFTYWNDLIYYIDNIDEHEWLCILLRFKKEIFELTHDQQHHSEFHRIYDQILISLFIKKLIQHLKTYILHCFKCKLNQTQWHTSYDLLHLISILSISFHIIIMNFILTLSSSNDLNNILIITDKFIKQVLLLSDKSIYSAVDWTNVLLLNLIDYDWSILH